MKIVNVSVFKQNKAVRFGLGTFIVITINIMALYNSRPLLRFSLYNDFKSSFKAILTAFYIFLRTFQNKKTSFGLPLLPLFSFI